MKQVSKHPMKKALFALGLAVAAMTASAAEYYIVVPFKQKASAPAAQNINVALSSYDLPAGNVGAPYPDFNLNSLLVVTGDSNYAGSGASWQLVSGELPPGLSLSGAGVITGTPTTKNLTGNSFQVLASYKTKSGQQAYTIVVNGAVLQVTSMAAGGFHTCAVTTAGGVKCWGSDVHGQLGDDGTLAGKQTPVQVAGLTSGVASVTAGRYHSCAVTTAGAVKCWGYDGQGQLGDDASLSNQPTPVQVAGLSSGVSGITAGRYHTCALTTTGGMKCWGYDMQGQLGNDASLSSQPTPVDVQGLTTGVKRIAAGGYHSCAVTNGGALKCWGDDEFGQLGNDSALSQQPTPVQVSGMSSGVETVAGGDYHGCAITTSGGLKCWGYDAQGQLGNDDSRINQPTPVQVSGLTSGVSAVSLGGYHSCAVTTAGGLKCWGYDAQGQLGNDGVMADQPTPVDVIGLTSGVASVYAGGYHTCARTTAGGTKCWGSYSDGQLGNNTITSNQPTPADVLP